ncbi:MAG: methyltransferase [Bacteroidia bacterium]
MEELKANLKQTFTAYWEFLALNAACELNLFDVISEDISDIERLSNKLKTNKIALQKLLNTLIELETIVIREGVFSLTEKGELLTENHVESLKNACILWAKEHLTAWQNLSYSIQTGKPSFEYLYQMPFFEYLQTKPKELKNYHLAMRDYAKDDYKSLTEIIDFSQHKKVLDVGGGLGTVVELIAKANPKVECWVLDLPEVTDLIEKMPETKFQIKSANFFENFNFQTDAIILSRVLHDWNEEKCLQILHNCFHALSQNGKVYIMEIMQDEVHANLLSLNMLLVCESYERTYQEYQQLLEKANFQLIERKPLNTLQTILIASKK